MTQSEFLRDVSPWNDHLPLLWLALQETDGSVAEFGAGEGSTPFLREYCLYTGREFYTYENNAEWVERVGSTLVSFKDPVIYRNYDVCLIDHAPGEDRHHSIAILKNLVKIIVIHDSEPEGGGNYQYDKIWHLFKHRVHLKSSTAWASAVSNYINVEKWSGREMAGYKIEI